MQTIIASQCQSVLELNCLQLYLIWPKAHWHHSSFVKSQIFWYLIFLCAGKIVILRKYQLIETLCGTVTISARFCQEELHISRFKCLLTKPESSHRSSQEPGSQISQLRLETWEWVLWGRQPSEWNWAEAGKQKANVQGAEVLLSHLVQSGEQGRSLS